jgi:hypothetical protein
VRGIYLQRGGKVRSGAKGKRDRWQNSGGRKGAIYHPGSPGHPVPNSKLVTKYGHVLTEICDKSKLMYREYALVPPKGVAPVTPTLATRETLFFTGRAASYRAFRIKQCCLEGNAFLSRDSIATKRLEGSATFCLKLLAFCMFELPNTVVDVSKRTRSVRWR